MSTDLLLGILDQSPVSEGTSGAEALRNTIDLARLADGLGYHRYWVAEHHGTPMLAGPSPEVLIGPIASATRLIRVGSGGVMLPHYSPLKVAENFSVLSGLFPGRIDLGIGRAPGTDARTAFALQRDRRLPAPDDFPDQLEELLAYLRDDGEVGPSHASLAAFPPLPQRPEVWLLGSSPQSAIWASELGLKYAFADFIHPRRPDLARLYRQRFEPGEEEATAHVAVAVSVICADTAEEAELIASSPRVVYALLRRGRLVPVPPVDKARRMLAELGLGPDETPADRRVIVGDPGTVRAGIEEVAAEYAAGEVIIVTITFEHTARRRSYELIAGAFRS